MRECVRRSLPVLLFIGAICSYVDVTEAAIAAPYGQCGGRASGIGCGRDTACLDCPPQYSCTRDSEWWWGCLPQTTGSTTTLPGSSPVGSPLSSPSLPSSPPATSVSSPALPIDTSSPSPALLTSPPASTPSPPLTPTQQRYRQLFLQQYARIHNASNGYFSREGIPYHSVETLIVEAPDYGHETTSEAFSYYIWLEAMYGAFTGEWTPLATAWSTLETYMIPSFQPTNGDYNPTRPATYAPEFPSPSMYPAPLDPSVPTGPDPIAAELMSKHGTKVYGMHWLMDVDNWYGYGNDSQPTLVNSYQRGGNESVWLTVPHPSIEEFKYGGPSGYLPLFVQDTTYTRQWRYTDAPDADARAVQAIYWAQKWANAAGGSAVVNALVPKAATMGDWLRYAMFDKYFKPIGSQSLQAQGNGYDSAHYLMAWYYGWGGPLVSQGWAFRIGSSQIHFGYQNPLTAWVLSNNSAFTGQMAAGGPRDYAISLRRQIQFYYWLQSAEGGIAGGVSNSLNGQYQPYPPGSVTFFGMIFEQNPVYNNPPSNMWFGWQAWSMERVAQYFHETKDPTVQPLLAKWTAWVRGIIRWGTVPIETEIPADLAWTGQPDASFDGKGIPPANRDLHVRVVDYGQDVGIMAALARALLYYGRASGDAAVTADGYRLVDAIATFQDPLGYSRPEPRPDYVNFNQEVYIPSDFSGVMPSGARIRPGATFLSLRPQYTRDPAWPRVSADLRTGRPPVFTYHRFWAQVEVALAFGVAAMSG